MGESLSAKGTKRNESINLGLQNKCFLSKKMFKLCNKDGMWQDPLRDKYLGNEILGEAGIHNFYRL
jgi:hypothetical protein